MDPELDDFEVDDVDGVNLTPMVNLSLVLVMIFMVASPFFSKELFPVNLPKAVTSETERQENISISISPKDGFSINEVPIKKVALQVELRRTMRRTGGRYVLIRADERVPHGEIEDVLKICKKLGVTKIAFATIPKI